MSDRKTRLSGASMGLHSHKNGFVTRVIRQHPSEHSVGIKSQNSYNASKDNHISDFRHALLRRLTSRILAQISWTPLTLVRICHVALPSHIIPWNYCDHWATFQKWFPLVHPDSSNQPRQRHHLPHGNHPGLLHNTRSTINILHSMTTRYLLSQATLTTRNHKYHHFLPLSTGLKRSPRKDHPRQSLRRLWPETWQYCFFPFILGYNCP